MGVYLDGLAEWGRRTKYASGYGPCSRTERCRPAVRLLRRNPLLEAVASEGTAAVRQPRKVACKGKRAVTMPACRGIAARAGRTPIPALDHATEDRPEWH